MKLLKYSPEFYEDIVNMFYDMNKEMYSNRQIGYRQAYYRDVDSWTSDLAIDVVLVVSDKDVVGFSKSFVSDNRGLYEPHYFTELLYIKPEYRKTRATHILSKNILEYGDEMNMTNVMNVRNDNGFSSMLMRYIGKLKSSYNIIDSFTTLEKRNNHG